MTTSWTRCICPTCVRHYYLDDAHTPWVCLGRVREAPHRPPQGRAYVTAARPRAEAAQIISDAIRRYVKRRDNPFAGLVALMKQYPQLGGALALFGGVVYAATKRRTP